MEVLASGHAACAAAQIGHVVAGPEALQQRQVTAAASAIQGVASVFMAPQSVAVSPTLPFSPHASAAQPSFGQTNEQQPQQLQHATAQLQQQWPHTKRLPLSNKLSMLNMLFSNRHLVAQHRQACSKLLWCKKTPALKLSEPAF